MLVELHLLTSHAPSNLNRDDMGRPKTALFGGVERARISSQAQKRAIRKSGVLADELDGAVSTRSLHIPLTFYLDFKAQHGFDEAAMERVAAVCEAVATALGKGEKLNDKAAEGFGLTEAEKPLALKTKQIVFLTQDEMDRLRAAAAEVIESDEKLTAKLLKALPKQLMETARLNEQPTDGVDMALFGRMTTDDANSFAAVDAAMQVAHPIATHETATETDYFTAVDDVTAGKGERGSGHIGAFDFNSALFYKYFSCDFEKLAQNMGGEREKAANALAAVLDTACRVTPTGKQNSFASHSQADVALLVVRERNVPCSTRQRVRAGRSGERVGLPRRERPPTRRTLLPHRERIRSGRIGLPIRSRPGRRSHRRQAGRLLRIHRKGRHHRRRVDLFAPPRRTGGRVMTGLLLPLDGPMQAWGDTGFGQIRGAGDFPSRSGVLGIVAAALGIPRADPALVALHDALRVHVAVVRAGEVAKDFHTVETREGKNKTLTWRDYHYDARFLSLIEGDADVLQSAMDALNAPVYTSFLGRRSCPPSTPLVASPIEGNPFDALVDAVVSDEVSPASERKGEAEEAVVYLDGVFGEQAQRPLPFERFREGVRVSHGTRRDYLSAPRRAYVNRPYTRTSFPLNPSDGPHDVSPILTPDAYFDAAS